VRSAGGRGEADESGRGGVALRAYLPRSRAGGRGGALPVQEVEPPEQLLFAAALHGGQGAGRQVVQQAPREIPFESFPGGVQLVAAGGPRGPGGGGGGFGPVAGPAPAGGTGPPAGGLQTPPRSPAPAPGPGG